MRIPISEAEPQLDELVLRAVAGEEVVLTRDGKDVVALIATPAAVLSPQRDEPGLPK